MRGVRNILNGQQGSILTAASIIIAMNVLSRGFGLVRQRVLLEFFKPEELSLFFAGFRVPDLLFEVLIMGALSSAFIPVFTKELKRDRKEAFEMAARVLNIGILVFIVFALIFFIVAVPLYSLIAPGFEPNETRQIAGMARVLMFGQLFFMASFVMTGMLESTRRFLIPALAPLFYNLGIILGTVVLYKELGLMAPAVGVVIGAIIHFAVQFPFSYKLGFRFVFSAKPDSGVRAIGKLATPRVIELSILQISRIVELFLASAISTASYTYFSLANSVQTFPVGLFGLSLAKAALPTLTAQSDDMEVFRKTLFSTLYQVIFFVAPFATLLIVLRIPVVRLLFGSDIFDWAATVQTGLVLSAFAVGVPFQAATVLLTRGFYALSDTKSPVYVSLIGTGFSVVASFVLIRGFGFATWALGAGYSVGAIFQAIGLYYLMSRRTGGQAFWSLTPIYKSITASLVSGGVMFFIIKFFDRSVWVKRLSFFSNVELVQGLDFQRFVIDTRFTVNLLALTLVTALIGGLVYLLMAFVLRSGELYALIRAVKNRRLFSMPAGETETVSPLPE